MERLQEQCVIELGISGMYKHSTFHGLQAFLFFGVIAKVKKKQQRLLFCKRLLALLSTTMMYGNKKNDRVLHCYVRC